MADFDMIDFDKPYCEIHGKPGVRYEQGGRLFDVKGVCVTKELKPSISQASEKEIPKTAASSLAAVAGELRGRKKGGK